MAGGEVPTPECDTGKAIEIGNGNKSNAILARWAGAENNSILV